MSPTRFVRPIEERDVVAVQTIYNHYITTSTATFEERELDVEQVRSRIEAVKRTGLPWIVLEGEGVEGYAYARPWHERAAYRYSAEVSLYLAPNGVGKGGGTELYRDLLQRLSGLGMHTAIGGIALPNPASIRLHEKFGFEKAALYKEVGFKFQQWIDVVYYQYFIS